MNGPSRPEYRANDLTPGKRYFDCTGLRAMVSTDACAQRWKAATAGSACHGCELGRAHHADHQPKAEACLPQHQQGDGICVRCGRSGLRIIQKSGVCVSCTNRENEWRCGRNAKGKPPARFVPPHEHEIAVSNPDGTVRRRLVPGQDLAEALGRLLRDLPQGQRVVTDERRRTSWNANTGRFEHVCGDCGAVGLVLERRRGHTLERHSWCCAGDPVGSGWAVAEVRQRVVALSAIAMASWLTSSIGLAGETPGLWTPTGTVCVECHRGQLEGRLTSPGGHWRVRCRGCGGGG